MNVGGSKHRLHGANFDIRGSEYGFNEANATVEESGYAFGGESEKLSGLGHQIERSARVAHIAREYAK